MIDPTELRIGNCVTLDNKDAWPDVKEEVMEIEGIKLVADFDFPASDALINLRSLKDEYTYSQFNQFVTPILIDPELLEEFGFRIVKSDNPSPSDWYWCHPNLQGSLWYGTYEFTGVESNRPRVKFLHQLQNLYFALTGEELTIKP